MENLLKQVRTKFSGVGQDTTEESSSSRERRIPPQKSQSFKGEKKRSQNWFQGQFSRQKSRGYDSNSDIEHVTAVAATACAISSLNKSGQQKKPSEIPEPLPSIKTKKDNTTIPAEDEKPAGKVIGPAPSMKRPPTFGDKQLSSTTSMKPESAMPKPDLRMTSKRATPSAEPQRQVSTKPGMGEKKADAWERAEMAKIEERYNTLNTRILTWEEKETRKAKKRLNRKESKLEQRRLEALQQFRSKTEYINQIAGGARAQAEERRRNEQMKAKTKATRIRATGEVPKTWFCF